MDECAEREEAASYTALSPMAHHIDENDDDGVEEHSDVGPGSSQASDGFTEVNALSPPRETPDDELPCSNCANYRDNTLKAFEAASDMARLQAQHQDLTMKYQHLVKNNASASQHVEESYKKLRDTEVQRDTLQGDLSLAVSEVTRLQEQNKQFLEAARLTDKHRQAADDWRGKYVQSQAILLEKSQKYGELEEKYKKAVDMLKAAVASSGENAKKASNLQDKLNLKNNENKALKKHWNVVARLVADISRDCSDDLPIALSQRLNKLPIEELLQIAKPHVGGGGVNDSDDEDAEAVQRLMNSDSGDSLASFISPRKSKAVRTNGAATAATAARGRGGRGGRGRTHSLGFAAGSSGEKNAVIDESMHENMLARKLHRDDIETMPTIKSDSVPNSIMGKKMETVRQQQERLKAGFKDKIAELKKERSSKEMDAKASIGSSTARPSSLEEDMILSEVDDDANDNNDDDAVDDSDKGDTVDDNNDEDVGTSVGIELPATTPIECDIGMPEIFDTVVSDGSATEDSSTTTSLLTQSVSLPLKGDSAMGPIADPIELNGEKNSLSTTPVQPPSPSKMIQYPKVVQLSQGESEVPRPSVEAKRERQSIAAKRVIDELPAASEATLPPSQQPSVVGAPRMEASTSTRTSPSESIDAKEAEPSSKVLSTPSAAENLREMKKREEEGDLEEAVTKGAEDEGNVAAPTADGTLADRPEDSAEHVHEASEDDEMEPGSCIVEGEEEAKNELAVGPAVEEEPFTMPTTDDDSELGDLVIDDGPNSPAATPRVNSPISPSEDSHESHTTSTLPASGIITQPTTVPNESSVAPAKVRSSPRLLAKQPKSAPVIRAPLISARTDAIPSDAPKIAAASSVVSLEEKRKAMVAGLSSASSSTRGGARTAGRGGRQAAGANAVRTNAATTGGSRTSAMESQMARMSKNMRTGKPVLSGTVRQRQPTTAKRVLDGPPAATKATVPPSQQPSLVGAPRITTSTSARNVAPPKAKPISETRPLKRKSSAMHAVEAMAIRAPEPKAKGKLANASSTTSGAEPSSLESRLIATVLDVCKEEQTVEKAMQHVPTITTTMTVNTIVKCTCKALMELPQSNTWNVVRANMSENVESMDRNRVVPKAERHLFALLMKMQENDDLKLAGLFDCFYDEYCRHVLGSMSTSNTTADVTRNVRCLFFALVASDRSTGEKMDEARKLFHQILTKKSSQAVCQSLVYLLSHAQTASLASEILKTELDDDEFGGRLISMHMNTKDAEVLMWAVDRFADPSCRTLATAAYRTPATLDMVHGWWKSDMEYLEKAKGCQGSVSIGENGSLVFDSFHKALMARMSALLSPEFRIEGLDRVTLLTQLDTPAIDEMDKIIPMRATETMRDHALFGDTSLASSAPQVLESSDARVLCLKIHTAIAALNSFYSDRMYGSDQREALRIHLASSIEKAHSILARSTYDVPFKQSSPLSEEDNHISLGITAIKNWINLIQNLTKKDLTSTPARSSSESSPVKKKARTEEYFNDLSSVAPSTSDAP